MKVVRIRRELYVGPENPSLEVSKIHMGNEKSPKFESDLSKYSVRISQNSRPNFFCKKGSKP